MIASHLAEMHLSSVPSQVSHVPSIQAPGNSHTANTPAFVWVHVSDIHFGAGDDHWRFDQKAVARSIVSDVERCPWVPERIFVTGDVAFSGRPDQYVLALKWLAQLASSAKVGLESVRVVPGNHDVDRGLAGNVLTRNLHHAARERPRELDALLQDQTARNHLGAKLAAYQKFVSEIPGHPAAVPHSVDWTELLPATSARRGSIRIAGLSSVWVSDEWDGRTRTAPTPLVPNMLVGLAQLEATLAGPSREEMLFLLTHHPVQWMAPDCATQLSSTLAPLAHVHLCGHVHDSQARLQRNLGHRGASLRYVAGAAHGDPMEAKKHGYSWGAIRFQAGRWEIGWAPRIYVVERGEMRSDSTRYDLDRDGFAWDTLDVSWMQYAPQQGT